MQFFPPTIGLDISPASIKAAILKKARDERFDLIALGQTVLSEGVITEGVIKDEDSFKQALEAMLKNKNNNFPNATFFVASLPEEKAFLRIVELPILKKEELAEALKPEIEANIPLTLDEVYYDYEILNSSNAEGHYDIMVNAVPKRIIDSYVSFFTKNNFHLLALEIESVAAARSLFNTAAKLNESILILDIGATKTRFMIVAEGILRFTSSSLVSGNRFNQLIGEYFSLSLKEAELIKKLGTLEKNSKYQQESLLPTLEPELIALKDQIQNYINFFETHPSREKFSNSAKKISKVFLTGGDAVLEGLTNWLSQELGLAVVLANAFKRINVTNPAFLTTPPRNVLAYTTALGLAMRNFEELK